MGILDVEFKLRGDEIAELKAEAEYERRLAAQYLTESEDASKSQEDRALAAEEFTRSNEHAAENEAKMATLAEIQTQITEEKANQKTRFDIASE